MSITLSRLATPAASTNSNANFSLDTSNVKVKKADAFDSMFDGDSNDSDVDDLPF